ncbi:MAG: DMT family transporter [Bauldia sp.]
MRDLYRAIAFLLIGVSLFSIMDGLGRFLAADFPVVQLVWARFAFAVPVLLATTSPHRWARLLVCNQPGLQAARTVLLLAATASILVSLTLMPLADVTAITFAAPLFVVALSSPLLRERVGLPAWVGVALGFVGVLIVARPGLGSFSWVLAFPLLAAFLFGLYQALTRLVSRGDPPITTLAWTILLGFFLTTPLLAFGWGWGSPLSWALLISTGLLFGVGHIFFIRAFALAPAAMITPFTYGQMVAAILFGVLVLGEVPDRWTLAGTALIILAGIYVLRRETGSRTELPAF